MNDKGLFYIVPHFLVEKLRKRDNIRGKQKKLGYDKINLY